MINANELRKGNYVTKGGTIWKIQWGSQIDNSDYVYPIPLTPEILEKCGFKKSHHGYFELNADFFNLCFDETGLDICLEDNDIASELKHIKTLHQLQNLYFDLSGEELEVNMQP